MTSVLDFYSAPGPLTSAVGAKHRAMLDFLPREQLGELAEIVANSCLYDVVAPDSTDIEVPESRREEIHYRSVDDMLSDLALEASAGFASRGSCVVGC